jgi:NitT/TauT family transport system permease protein
VKKDFLVSIVCSVISIGSLWLLWESSTVIGWKYSNIFPPPSVFLAQLKQDEYQVGLGSQTASVAKSIVSSVIRVTVGLIIATLFSLFTSFLINKNIWIRRFIMPLIRIIAPIAPIAWIPLGLVIIGLGNATAIFIVFMGVFFTLTISICKTIDLVPSNLINSAKTLGASPNQLWWKVTVPFILPAVFTSLRLNFIAAWMAVLAAEMNGLSDGLGAIIMTGRNLFNHKLILLGMLLIGVTGYFFDLCLKMIQDKFFWWDKSK